MKAEQVAIAEAIARRTTVIDPEFLLDDEADTGDDIALSYLTELLADWNVIRAERAAARSRGEHLPLTPFQLRIGRECARMETALRKAAAHEVAAASSRRVPPRSSAAFQALSGSVSRRSRVPEGSSAQVREANRSGENARSAERAAASASVTKDANVEIPRVVPPVSATPPTPSGSSRKQLRNAEKHRKRQERKKLERARHEALNAARKQARKQANKPQPPALLPRPTISTPASATATPAYRAQAS